ncbi:MAG: YfbM family protein [Candidatus Sulfotelmatobacter sp.]
MHGHLREITPVELERLQEEPEAVEEFIHFKMLAQLAKIEAAVDEQSKIARAAGRELGLAEERKIRSEVFKKLMEESPLQDGPDSEGLRLEKSWHVLHYLLTGGTEAAPPPLGSAIMGGEEIGEERDYGRVRFLNPPQVQEVAAALASISKEDLVRRCDIHAMAAAKVIYACRDESELELALHYFEQVSLYYADTAAHGNAMLLYVD